MQRRAFALIFSFGLVVTFLPTTALAQSQLTNLDSNQFHRAQVDDPLIVNAWGMARSSGSPWWISDEGSGWSTLYNAQGVKQGLVVSVPAAAQIPVGSPTGIVFFWYPIISDALSGSARHGNDPRRVGITSIDRDCPIPSS